MKRSRKDKPQVLQSPAVTVDPISSSYGSFLPSYDADMLSLQYHRTPSSLPLQTSTGHYSDSHRHTDTDWGRASLHMSSAELNPAEMRNAQGHGDGRGGGGGVWLGSLDETKSERISTFVPDELREVAEPVSVPSLSDVRRIKDDYMKAQRKAIRLERLRSQAQNTHAEQMIRAASGSTRSSHHQMVDSSSRYGGGGYPTRGSRDQLMKRKAEYREELKAIREVESELKSLLK
eukprot:GHVQ01033688.1.p1 GENE.GHVQ01033688.1~~GHVQ01033688.1.p1  ORF type:complete len:265 (+),score=67.87 GHVQ01033688.1:98-796(+)